MALNIKHLIVIADDSGEGIEEIISCQPLASKDDSSDVAGFLTFDEAVQFAEAALRFPGKLEYLDEGYYRLEGARPDATGLMSMWLVEEAE